MIRRHGVALAPLLVAFALFWPLQRWPANDDFLFYRNVQLWSEAKQLAFTTLNGMPTVSCAAHCGLGWLSASVAGFGFFAVQTSGFLVCLAGVVAMHGLAVRLGASQLLAASIACTLATGPFFFGHSFTFMTDAPATAWLAIALAAYAKAWLRTDTGPSALWLCIGSLAALFGIWTRQTNVALLFVPICMIWRTSKRGSASWQALSALGLPAAGLLAVAMGLFDTGALDAPYPGKLNRLDLRSLKQFAIAGYGGAMLCGLFVLPFAFAFAQQLPKLPLLVATAIAAVLCSGLIVTGGSAHLTNATGYFLQNAHFGPILLADNYEPGRWGNMNDVAWPSMFWQALTVASFASVSFLFVLASQRIVGVVRQRSLRVVPTVDFFALGIVLSLMSTVIAYLAAFETRFDRYWMTALIPLLALTAWLLPNDARRPALRIVWIFIACQLTVSYLFTHDYLAWNNARWRLFERAVAESGFKADEVDGGYEINGWTRSGADPDTKAQPGAERLWTKANAFRIAHVATSADTILDREGWSSWALAGRRCQLLLLAPRVGGLNNRAVPSAAKLLP